VRRPHACIALAGLLALVALVAWPRGDAPERHAAPRTAAPPVAPTVTDAKPPVPGARITLLDFPAGEPVPAAELHDDPNRIPGPPLVVRGTVRRSGSPVAGAVVRLCRAFPERRPYGEHEPLGATLAEATTDAGGAFRLETARRSRLVVEARHPGSALRRVLLYGPLRGQPDPITIDLRAGRRLAIHVLRPDGAPVSGVPVTLLCGDGRIAPIWDTARWAYEAGHLPRIALATRTDSGGRAAFEDLEAGLVELVVAGVHDFLVAPAGGEIAVVLERPGRVEGVLRDAAGRPVGGATLTVETVGLRNRTGWVEGATDDEGHFRIEGVPPGWIIAGRVAGQGTVDAPVARVPAGGAATWEPVLRDAVVCCGIVRGAPPAGARIVIFHPDAMSDIVAAEGWTDGTGAFAVRVSEAGPYRVTAEAYGLFGSSEAIGGGPAVEVRLEPCARVVAHVEGLEDLVLYADPGGRAHADPTGRFVFDNVPPQAGVALRPWPKDEFDVPAGKVMVIERDARMKRIVGCVRNADGDPLPRTVIHLPGYGFLESRLIQPNSPNTTETDDHGRYELLIAYRSDLSSLAFGCPGYIPAYRNLRLPPPGGTVTVDVTLRPGARLHGRIVDAAGAPVRRAYVCIYPEHSPPVRDSDDYAIGAGTFTDSDGAFAFEGLSPGAYTVYHTEDIMQGPQGIEAHTGEAEVLIVIEETGFIAGILTDERGHVLDGGVFVVRAGERGFLAGKGGRFRIENLAPGRYDVRVEGDLLARGVATGTEDLVLRLPR